MFVAAAAGAKVAKHGNRSVSSSSGSVDVLEALGVNLQLTRAQIAQCLQQLGLGFMFAPSQEFRRIRPIGAISATSSLPLLPLHLRRGQAPFRHALPSCPFQQLQQPRPLLLPGRPD